MAREKYQTLTEQMFYILLCLQSECCGVDIMKRIAEMTEQRVTVGPGTLYALLDNFAAQGFITQTNIENRKKSYVITEIGKEMLNKEYIRLHRLTNDYETFMKEVL
ncbi:MAG: PadR family transcriptional regulator [Oscillospiraceae bacterium]